MSTHNSELLGVYRSNSQWRMVGKTIRALDAVLPSAAAALAELLFTTPTRHKPRAWEQPVMARAERRGIPFDRGELQLYCWEPKGEGNAPTVLLVHGWAGRPGQFAGMIEALVESGYRVLSFDWPGHGRSSGRRSNAYLASRAVAAVVAAEGEPAAIVSHSVGGMAVALALEAGVRTDKLVMINTPTDPQGIFATFAQALDLPARTGQLMMQRFERRLGRPFASLDLRELVGLLPEQTLLIHDRDDSQVPLGSSRRLLERRPELPLRVTQGLGHNRVLGDADVTALVLAHLERVEAAPRHALP